MACVHCAQVIAAVRFFGAVELATIPDLVKDPSGKPHDLVYLSMPRGRYWRWTQF